MPPYVPGDTSPVAGGSLRFARADHGGHPRSGAGAPAPALGEVGDLYLDTTGGDFYNKTGAGWVVFPTAGGNVPSPTVVAETAFGQAPSAGVAGGYSRGDHTHGTPAIPPVPSPSATVVTETAFGQASTPGAAADFSRGDHTHGTPAAPPAPPAPSATVVTETAFGQASTPGAATDFSRGDHTHGTPAAPPAPPAPSATVVTETAFGQASTPGAAADFSRGDHTHGTPAAPPAPPAPSATVVTETAFGQASTPGAAADFSRGDHTHGTPAAPVIPGPLGTVSAETSFALAPNGGTLPGYFSMADHTHGTPEIETVAVPAIDPTPYALPGPLTWIVGPDPGADYPDIDAANASIAVANGDTLHLQGNPIYHPLVTVTTITKRLRIRGDGANVTVYSFDAASNLICTAPIVIEDLTLLHEGVPASGKALVSIQSATADEQNTWIRRVIFQYREEAINWTNVTPGFTVQSCAFIYLGGDQNNYTLRGTGLGGGKLRLMDLDLYVGNPTVLAPRTRVLYLTGTPPGWQGEIICERWYVNDIGSPGGVGLRSVFMQDSFAGYTGQFGLTFRDIRINCPDTVGAWIFYPSNATDLGLFSRVIFERCTCRNTSGKGLLAFDSGLAIVGPHTLCPLEFQGCVIGLPAVTAPLFSPAQQPDIGQIGVSAAFGAHV